ncbi:hypothetical protein MSMAT_2576 [Methanosarcina mazei TMA]|uniref:DUF488 domain-containing protein n=1 Tax=Methanosarcina mazei TaxID=2209 RepID=UPI001C341B9D|nr:DUF488 domain-containing protein [Methanosarcina mazei]UWJ23833.1 hypothetical protein MSMAT_2576 [Methanosarcina mazei TMA]BBL64607.1 hypothetical protein MmazTMA_15840 [Methanosarcina mazei]
MIRLKRIYEQPSDQDGFRVLVDRLWPRGLRKNEVRLDLWLKEIAPSDELRKWFSHDPEKWEEFRKCYLEELKLKEEYAQKLIERARETDLTLLYAAKNEDFNNATVLKEYLESRLQRQ